LLAIASCFDCSSSRRDRSSVFCASLRSRKRRCAWRFCERRRVVWSL
jgi:hypothetical protein